MPSWKTSNYRDTPRWQQCLGDAAQAMVADGWNKHARKFRQVQQRRALSIYQGNK